MAKYILTVGDDIVSNGTKEELSLQYKKHLKAYKTDKRPSREPNLWKKVSKDL